MTPNYLHGSCDVYAVALHQETGLPIEATLDYVEDIGIVLVHAYVRDGDDIIDYEGKRSYEEMIVEMPDTWEPWREQLTPRQVLKLGGHKKSCVPTAVVVLKQRGLTPPSDMLL